MILNRKTKNIITSTTLLAAVYMLFANSALSFNIGNIENSKIEVPVGKANSENSEVKYWDNGNVRMITEYNGIGTAIGIAYFRDDGSLEQEKTFDDRGNNRSIAYFNSRGGLKMGSDGWAAVMWKYDNGVMRGQGYYDEEGKLQRYKVYNAAGDLVCKKYIGDEEPDLNELYSTNSTTRAPQSFEFYDSYGRPQGKVTAYQDDGFFPYDYPYWYNGRYPHGYYQRYSVEER